MEELGRLLDDLTRSVAALNRVGEGLSLPDADFTVSDEDAVVTVFATAGGVVTSIRVVPNWAAKVSEDDLPIRINSTLALAGFRAMGMAVPDGKAPAATTPSPAAEVSPASIVPTADDRRAAERIADRAYESLVTRVDAPGRSEGASLERFYRNADALDAALGGASAGEEEQPTDAGTDAEDALRLRSENGAVSALMTPFGLGDVRFRDGWLKGTSGNVVTTCLAEILDRATPSDHDLADALRDIARLSRGEAPAAPGTDQIHE